jgi:hypothetical protein
MSKNNATKGLLFDPIIDTEASILTIRAAALALVAEGKTIMEYNGEGTEYKRRFTLPVEQVLSETRYCLKQINPQKYGWATTTTRPYYV